MEPSNVLFCGNLDARVDRKLLYELGVQAGPVVSVNATGKGYGFIVYPDTEGCTYAMDLFRGLVTLYGRSIRFDYGKPRT